MSAVMKPLNRSTAVFVFLAIFAGPVSAGPLSIFNPSNGWTDFTSNTPEDCLGGCNQVYPGYGGQLFDAEYLFYKLEGSHLSIGLQSGFDLIDGHVEYHNRDYYTGDLALTINGTDYGVDFGLKSFDYSGNAIDIGSPVTPGQDDAGLYENPNYTGNLAFSASSPFAMDAGTEVPGGLVDQDWGSGPGDDNLDSYYRIVKLNLDTLGINSGDTVDFTAHWTMSCGNDAIDGRGQVTVPEPTTLTLLGIGLFGLAFLKRRRTNTV